MISVIVTTYNDACYLPACLVSIENQTYRPFEVIIVDDGSDDDSAERFVLDNKFSFPVFFFKKENGGASTARNFGLSKARGDFVAFIDVDDKWCGHNLEYKLEILKGKSNEYFGTYGGYLSIPKGRKSKFQKYDGCLDPDQIGRPFGYPGGAPMYLFRKHALEKVNGFDVRLKQNEDFDLILKLIHEGYLAVGDNEATYIRNLRIGSLTRNFKYEERYDSAEAFLQKADITGYLSKEEIERRRALNALSFWKNCFFNFQSYKRQKELLDIFFKAQDFKRFRYLPLFLYKKVLGCIF